MYIYIYICILYIYIYIYVVLGASLDQRSKLDDYMIMTSQSMHSPDFFLTNYIQPMIITSVCSSRTPDLSIPKVGPEKTPAVPSNRFRQVFGLVPGCGKAPRYTANSCWYVPSGKTNITIENHNLSWENSL